MSKKVCEQLETWILHCNHILEAIRLKNCHLYSFYIIVTQYYPLIIFWKPKEVVSRRRTQDRYRKAEKSFVLVHQHLKKSNKRQAKYANKNSEYTEFQVEASVYLRQQQCKSKLQGRLCPYNQITEKIIPVIFHIKNQLQGTITKPHAEHTRLANSEEWRLPKDKKNRPLHKARQAAPISSSPSDDMSADREAPLSKTVQKCRKQTETLSEEHDVPLMNLAKWIFRNNLIMNKNL